MNSASEDPPSGYDAASRVKAAIREGRHHSADELLPLIYDELQRLAIARIASESPGQTLQANDLVHEAYLRLVGSDPDVAWDGQGHFFAAAAEAMRRILIERARRKRRIRHGGGFGRIDLDKVVAISDETSSADLEALQEALELLAVEEPAIADLVRLRYFAGLTTEQAAKSLGISLRTANRHWAVARVWLYQRLDPGEAGASD